VRRRLGTNGGHEDNNVTLGWREMGVHTDWLSARMADLLNVPLDVQDVLVAFPPPALPVLAHWIQPSRRALVWEWMV
jgi:hypothetical protein